MEFQTEIHKLRSLLFFSREKVSDLERDLTAARERLAECEKQSAAKTEVLLQQQVELARVNPENARLRANLAQRYDALKQAHDALKGWPDASDWERALEAGVIIERALITEPEKTDPTQLWREVVEALVKESNIAAALLRNCPFTYQRLTQQITRAEALLKDQS
jgi:hypothetical protein